MADRSFEFFFDIASGYSWLASTQVEALARRTGSVAVWKPFSLGFAFKATGNETPARIPAKAAWLTADLARWAKRYGIAYTYPSRFPIASMGALRLLVAARRMHGDAALPALAATLFAAAWEQDRNVADPLVLARCAQDAGFDPEPLLAALEAPETKAELKANTDEAIARQVFGAPAFFVDGELHWGNDRLDFVEDALRARA
ncbi:MAG: 2-hydroxychromene-2-carboxylate isomerase [Burkholderiales bacterium]|nr:MAG: 2-hydroxychromene-2-carboxylate isomerase [Burkholderiales bacterium]